LVATAGDAIASRAIYTLAVQAIMQEPVLLITGLWRNLSQFFINPMFEAPASHYLGFANSFWWLGLVAMMVWRRDPRYSLVGWLSLGLVASAAIITIDGGVRAFAAGLPVQALQASLGMAWIINLVVRATGKVVPETANLLYKPTALGLSLAITAVLIVLLPLTPVRQLFAASPVENPQCGPGLLPVVVRMGFETHFLAIVPDAEPLDVFRMRVAEDRLIKRLKADKSTQEDLAKLPKPITIVRAWPLNQGPPERPWGEVRFFADGDFSRYMYRTVDACLKHEQEVEIAEAPYSRAVSITVSANRAP
jgi:hypothetical protein